MSDYFDWKDFSGVYLEDSFVRHIIESENQLVFDMEFVLTKEHPLFEQPKIGEQYCYHRGIIVFSGISSVNWIEKSNIIFHDANNEEDYGNIDVLRKINGDMYEINGDFGKLRVTSSRLTIIL